MNPIASAFLCHTRFIWNRIFIILIFLFVDISSIGQEENPEMDEIKVEKSPEKNADNIVYGIASYYAQKFHGRQTANGEIFSQQKFTAACNVLPLGTWIQVTNLRNGKIIVVRTNDRLHPKTRRILDLTYAGADRLGFIKNGLAKVKIEILNQKIYKKLGKKNKT